MCVIIFHFYKKFFLSFFENFCWTSPIVIDRQWNVMIMVKCSVQVFHIELLNVVKIVKNYETIFILVIIKFVGRVHLLPLLLFPPLHLVFVGRIKQSFWQKKRYFFQKIIRRWREVNFCYKFESLNLRCKIFFKLLVSFLRFCIVYMPRDKFFSNFYIVQKFC